MKLIHVLILSSDMAATNHFWTEILGLELGDRPPFPFEGSWLYSESKPIIHVVPYSAEYGNGAVDHIALEGSNYATLITSLRHNEVHYNEVDVPLTGEHQVFITAPDNIKVEMLFPSGFSDTQPTQQASCSWEIPPS